MDDEALSTNDERYVFISYARSDLKSVNKIVRTLEGLGFKTWFDQSDIIGGQKFETIIEQGVDHCEIVLFTMSPDSLRSSWCAKEYARAKKTGKPVIPALLATVDSASNPFHDVHWVDFLERDDRDAFDRSIYLLVRAMCALGSFSNCERALADAQKRTGSEHIESKIEDIRENVLSTQAWLAGIDRSFPDAPVAWHEVDKLLTTTKLTGLAAGRELRDHQIMAHAAQTIARSGNQTALRQLAELISPERSNNAIFDAFYQISSVRADRLPRVTDLRKRLLILWQIAKRQVREAPVLWPILCSVGAGVVALWYAFFISFGPDAGVRPLGRIGHATSSIPYAIALGGAIALILFVFPKLRILGAWRHPLGVAIGWVLVFSTFLLLNKYVNYRNLDESVASVAVLSAVLITGYGLASYISPTDYLRTGTRAALAFTGAFVALYWPCDWGYVWPRLIMLEQGGCLDKAILIGAILALVPLAPELWGHLSDRGAVLQKIAGTLRRAS